MKRRLIGAREPHIGVALLAPSAGHGAEDIGLCLDKYRLLFWIKLDHAPVVVRIAERGKDALAHAKIGVSLVCAFDYLGQAQSNAAEAIDGTGTVTLRARAGRAALGGRETNTVILEVSDTGKGIPPEVEKRLFDPFFSTKETGTGLGLPIAARIIERHGGVLQYQTRPGHGTTFGIVLPREMNDIPGSARNSTNMQSVSG